MWGFLGTVFSIFAALFLLGEIGLEPFRQFAPCEQDAPPTAFAFQPDVCAETSHGPFVGAAWMLFAEPQVIVDVKVGKHGWEDER